MLSKKYIELFEDIVSDKIKKILKDTIDNYKKEDLFVGANILNLSDYSIDIKDEDGNYELWNNDVPLEIEVPQFIEGMIDAFDKEVGLDIAKDIFSDMANYFVGKDMEIRNYYDRMYFTDYNDRSWDNRVNMRIVFHVKKAKYDKNKDTLVLECRLDDIHV